MSPRDRTGPRPAVPTGLVGTPFEARLRALSSAEAWADWAGRLSPRVLREVAPEYFAIRNQASLFDLSPMRKYRIEGLDAARVANRLVTRDVAGLAPGRVAYVLWCAEDGDRRRHPLPARARSLPALLPGAPARLAARRRLGLRRGDHRRD